MLKKLCMTAILPALVMLVVLVSPAAAQAAQNTWLPQFDKDKHVYVDPDLSNHRSYPVRFSSDFEQKLIEAGKKNNVAIYVVAVEQGDEALPAGLKWGVFKLDELLGKWQVQADFPTQDYLVIMWVRFQDDPAHGSVAANGGSRLKGYGLTGDRFSDANGPVIPVLKQYMRADPERAFLTIVGNVNGEIDRAIQAEQDRIEHERFMKALPGIILKVVLGLLFLGLAIWLTIRYFRERRRTRETIAKWRERLESANANYLKLYDGYFVFLKEQADWATRFKGETLTRYKAAVSDFAEFTLRQKRANELVDQAQKFADRCIFPMVGGYRRAQSLLTRDDVVITGQELPLEMASLFGGIVAKSTYSPEKLLDAMANLFDRTNKALGSIRNAFRGAEQNKSDIEGLLPEVAAARQTLEGKELTFDPYSERFATIQEGIASFLSILTSDPLAAFRGSEEVEEAVRQLKADLERAASIKDRLAQVETEIDGAENHGRQARSKNIGYAYPLADGEKPPEGAASALFILMEENGNPDPVVASARKQLAAAHASLLAGKLDQSEKESGQATDSAKQARLAVNTVMAAKDFVEKQIPYARAALGKLTAAVPAATTAVGELRSDFLPKNTAGEPEKLDTANRVIQASPADQAKIKAAYDEQRYLAARALTERFALGIEGSRRALVEVHSRLETLRKLRQDSRDVASATRQKVQALGRKLADNAFTTSATTDGAYSRFVDDLGRLEAEVAKQIADWPTLAQTAGALAGKHQEIDRAIDTEKAEHQSATSKVSALSTAISEAQGYVNHGDTRQPARSKLAEARQAHADIQARMQRPKSDWASLGRQADDAVAIANRARDLAAADARAASEARSAISSAESKISSVDRFYGHGVTADLSSAQSYARNARGALSRGDYEQAKRDANSAYSSADSAESAAQARVAAIIAAIEAERRRQEEAAEAARRAAEEASRSSSYDYGSSSGGGGSYDWGGSSGGGSYGGGSGGGDY